MICAGVDVGSVMAKAAVYDGARGEVLGGARRLTGWSPRESGNAALHAAVDAAGLNLDALSMIVGTGYGRVALPFADETVTEVSCHARGAHLAMPAVRTVIDIGGQDSKVISVDERGHPKDFAMNDRCAAGTGRFFQVMAGALGVELDELGGLALRSRNPAALSSVCTVFAESEVVGLIAGGAVREDIAAGLCEAVARRVAALAGQVGLAPQIMLTGGVAYNEGVVAALEKALGVEVVTPADPQMIGATGAAVIATERVIRRA